MRLGVWDCHWNAEKAPDTTVVFTGREYGVEIRCGDRRHWRLTRKQVHWTSEINWTEMGTIARLLIDKGFGFIRTENGAEYFFHRSSVRWAVFELLREGQRVQFNLEESTHGPRAAMVRLIEG